MTANKHSYDLSKKSAYLKTSTRLIRIKTGVTARSQSSLEKKDYAPTQKGMQIAVASGKNKIQLYISFSEGLSADNIIRLIFGF